MDHAGVSPDLPLMPGLLSDGEHYAQTVPGVNLACCVAATVDPHLLVGIVNESSNSRYAASKQVRRHCRIFAGPVGGALVVVGVIRQVAALAHRLQVVRQSAPPRSRRTRREPRRLLHTTSRHQALDRNCAALPAG